MPCTYTGSLEGDRALAAEEALSKKVSSLTKVTEFLCYVLEKLENSNNGDVELILRREILGENDNLNNWWVQHKKQDNERIKEEALKKLSKREREALGYA